MKVFTDNGSGVLNYLPAWSELSRDVRWGEQKIPSTCRALEAKVIGDDTSS